MKPPYSQNLGPIESAIARAKFPVGQSWSDEDADLPGVKWAVELISDYIETIVDFLRVEVDVEFCVNDGEVPNAIAINSPRAIVLTSSLLLSLQNIAGNVFTYYSPSDGLSSVDCEEVFSSRLEGLQHILKVPVLPVDRDARLRVEVVVEAAIGFVVLHELGHIVNGHLDAGFFRVGAMDEIYSSNLGGDPLTWRTLEMDADCFAALHLLNFYLSKQTDPSPAKIFDDVCGTVFWGIAVASLWLEAVDRGRPVQQMDHPPPLHRFLYVLGMLFERTSGFPGGEEGAARRVTLVRLQREVALQRAGFPKSKPEDMDGGPQWTEQMNALNARWREVRPRLLEKKFGNGDLAPPIFILFGD